MCKRLVLHEPQRRQSATVEFDQEELVAGAGEIASDRSAETGLELRLRWGSHGMPPMLRAGFVEDARRS